MELAIFVRDILGLMNAIDIVSKMIAKIVKYSQKLVTVKNVNYISDQVMIKPIAVKISVLVTRFGPPEESVKIVNHSLGHLKRENIVLLMNAKIDKDLVKMVNAMIVEIMRELKMMEENVDQTHVNQDIELC